MSDEFIVNQLFVPFKQQDPFSPGAGLGLSSWSFATLPEPATLTFSYLQSARRSSSEWEERSTLKALSEQARSPPSASLSSSFDRLSLLAEPPRPHPPAMLPGEFESSRKNSSSSSTRPSSLRRTSRRHHPNSLLLRHRRKLRRRFLRLPTPRQRQVLLQRHTRRFPSGSSSSMTTPLAGSSFAGVWDSLAHFDMFAGKSSQRS